MAGRVTTPGQQMAQTPCTAGPETQDDQMTVGAQNAVHLAQQRVRRGDQLQCVRQQHDVDRIGGDGQAVGMTLQVSTVLGAPFQ